MQSIGNAASNVIKDMFLFRTAIYEKYFTMLIKTKQPPVLKRATVSKKKRIIPNLLFNLNNFGATGFHRIATRLIHTTWFIHTTRFVHAAGHHAVTIHVFIHDNVNNTSATVFIVIVHVAEFFGKTAVTHFHVILAAIHLHFLVTTFFAFFAMMSQFADTSAKDKNKHQKPNNNIEPGNKFKEFSESVFFDFGE